jgi:hypothetical protein
LKPMFVDDYYGVVITIQSIGDYHSPWSWWILFGHPLTSLGVASSSAGLDCRQNVHSRSPRSWEYRGDWFLHCSLARLSIFIILSNG